MRGTDGKAGGPHAIAFGPHHSQQLEHAHGPHTPAAVGGNAVRVPGIDPSAHGAKLPTHAPLGTHATRAPKNAAAIGRSKRIGTTKSRKYT